MLRQVLIALVEVQLEELRRCSGPPLGEVSPVVVAEDILRYLDELPPLLGDVMKLELGKLEVELPLFSSRPLAERVARLRDAQWTGLAWSVLSFAFAACWLVMFSRPELRRALSAGSLPSDPAAQPNDYVVFGNTRAPLHRRYDVCVIGSGAGGAMVAQRLGAAGHEVLLLDAGSWVPPQQLGTRHDVAFARLYKNAGVQPALPSLDAVLAQRLSGLNVLQARVVGGGPYVNNAVQIPISRAVMERTWEPRGFPIAWEELLGALRVVAGELRCGLPSLDPLVPPDPRAVVSPGERNRVVEEAAARLWAQVGANPVAMWDCVGCGFCNLGCRFNRKTGGVHGPRSAGAPQSYLMRALTETAGHVHLRSEMQAERFELGEFGRVARLLARDQRTGALHSIRARSFVLAAGAIASSRVLQATPLQRTSEMKAIGEGIAVNLTSPITASFAEPFAHRRPDPGTQMCFHVAPESGLLVEGWFDFPAGLSAGTSGLPRDVAGVVGEYRRTHTTGVVVPVDDLLKVQAPPIELVSDLRTRDYRRLLRAVAHASRALYAAGAASVSPGHRLNTNRVGPLVIDRAQALAGDIDGIAAELERRLESPMNLSMQTPHPQGGNPIARTAQQGVVGERFQVYGTENLFVADASLFPAACGTNPQMTVLALAHLAAQRIDEHLDERGA